jgi:hypothetical protein
VRTTKDTGLGHLPSKSWDVNLGWCHAITIAVDLLAWLRPLGLTGDLGIAEPATLRYRILTTPARLTRGQRYRWLRLPKHWPWATALADNHHQDPPPADADSATPVDQPHHRPDDQGAPGDHATGATADESPHPRTGTIEHRQHQSIRPEPDATPAKNQGRQRRKHRPVSGFQIRAGDLTS